MAVASSFLSLQQFQALCGNEKPYYESWTGEAVQNAIPTALHGFHWQMFSATLTT